MKIVPFAVSLVAGLAGATAAAAAPPTASDLTPGFSFIQYSGSAQVGTGAVDISSTIFYIDEKAVDGWKSWYVFFDPARAQHGAATIDFGRPIHAVLTTHAELDATNATYGIDINGDGVFNDYGTSLFIGLEGRDKVSWSPGGTQLKLDWYAIDPGDHIRVLVAVPEPSSYLLFGAGLLGLGLTLRRRRG